MPPLLDWCWTHVRVGLYPFAALSLPTSGLAWRGRRRGAQLDGEFAFYASRRRLRAWPGGGGGGALRWTVSLRSTPGGGDEGRAAGRGLAFYASCRRLRAWPGGGSGGARSLGAEFVFLSFTHWPFNARPSYARSLVPTPSKTVDQTPPALMGWGTPAPLCCELNLLGRPCGAGCVNKESVTGLRA